MADEPTSGEVERALDRFRQDVREDMVQFRFRLDEVASHAVTTDAYQGGQQVAAERLARLQADIERLGRAAESDRREAREWRERKNSGRKFLIGAVILPIGLEIVSIIVAIRGAK